MRNRPSIVTISIVLFLLFLAAVSAVPPVTFRSGHAGAVQAVRWHGDEEVLFTAGNDGKLMVWHPSSNRLLQSIRVGRYPVRKIALYPDGERVAVLSGDGQRTFRLTVWNWRSGERLFRHTMDNDILWMEISPQGSYLLYSTPELRSMRVLDAQSGRELPFLRQNTGIVSWFVPATSEERVMTYTPANGRIEYRSIVTGSVAATFQGPAGIEQLVLLDQRRYAAGRSASGQLIVLDLLNGTVVAETAAGDIETIRRDENSPDIVVLSRAFGGNRAIRRYRFENGTLQQRFVPRREIGDETSNIVAADREFFGTDPEGRILRWSPFAATPVVFAENQVQPVLDMTFSSGQLQILTASQLLTINSDFFRDLSFINHRTSRVAATPGTRFLVAGERDIMLWTPGSLNTPLQSFSSFTSGLTPTIYTIPQNAMVVQTTATEVLVLTRNGNLQLLDRASGEQSFSYRSGGSQTALRTPRDIFLGKSSHGGVLDSAILRIDPRSGQTVPLDSEADLVFSLHYDNRRGRLFAIGVRSDDNNRISTILEVFDGINFQRRRVILEVPGEYLDANLVIDETTGSTYTTLDDRGGILRWDGIRVSELDRNQGHIPRRLALVEQHLLSVNWDGTLSVIDRQSGSVLIDLFVVAGDRPGAWLALQPDGGVYTSQGTLATARYLSVNVPGTSLERFLFRPQQVSPVSPDPSTFPGRPGSRFEDFRQPDPPEPFDPESGAPAPSS